MLIMRFSLQRLTHKLVVSSWSVQTHLFLLFLDVSSDSVSTFDVFQLCTSLLGVHSLPSFCRLIVKYDQVSIRDIVAGEMLTSGFGVEDVFVNDKCCSASVWSISAENDYF